MADIDVGSGVANRADYVTGAITLIDLGNPANLSGILTQVQIWANQDMLNVEVATFFLVSGSNYSTRDSQSIGTVSAGSQSFPVSLNVRAGDYLGLYYSGGRIEKGNSGGSGTMYYVGDAVPCTELAFALLAVDPDTIISLYGTGKTLGGPKSNPALILIGRGGI